MESEYIKIEGHHEGLVTEELFREAQNYFLFRVVLVNSPLKEC